MIVFFMSAYVNIFWSLLIDMLIFSVSKVLCGCILCRVPPHSDLAALGLRRLGDWPPMPSYNDLVCWCVGVGVGVVVVVASRRSPLSMTRFEINSRTGEKRNVMMIARA